jgi:hypothetical protein
MRLPKCRFWGPKVFLSVVVVGLVLLPARRCRADFIEDFLLGVLVVSVVGGVGIGANLAFTIHDASLAADGELPSKGWAIAETVITPAEALMANGGLVVLQATGEARKEPAYTLLLVPAIWSSQMATHGIWGLASDKVKPGDLYGVSWAIGANLAFTSGAVGAAIEKRLGGVYFGVAEMIGTTPTIVVGLSRFATTRRADPAAWAALMGWSGALFLHGMASTVMGFKEAEAEEEREKKEKAGKTAFQWMAAPTLVSDGVVRAPGIMVGGVF